MNGKRKRYLKSLRTKKIPKTKPVKYKRLNLPKITLADFTEGKKPPIVTKKSRREAYMTFLQTDYWKKVRDLVLKRDKNTCQGCGNTKYLQVHHKTYKNHLNELENLQDLITLCRICHKNEHKQKEFFTSN